MDDLEIETMSEQCQQHSDLMFKMGKIESNQDTQTKALDRLTDRFSQMETRFIWWAGGISVSGSIIVGIISNFDKIKGMFS